MANRIKEQQLGLADRTSSATLRAKQLLYFSSFAQVHGLPAGYDRYGISPFLHDDASEAAVGARLRLTARNWLSFSEALPTPETSRILANHRHPAWSPG